jgi:signal transduction histidine kinase
MRGLVPEQVVRHDARAARWAPSPDGSGGGAVRNAWLRPLVDVGVPAVLAVLAVVQLTADPPPGSPALVTASALAAVLPLALRRRAPLAVTVVVSLALIPQVIAGNGTPATFASFLAAMVCVYTLVRYSGPRAIGAGLGVLAVAVVATTVLQERTTPFSAFDVVYPLAYFGIAGGLGALIRQRALRMAAVEDRAVALEERLEREAELAAAEERTRIARELHDVVAHGLSLMVVQAEAAEELLNRSPDDARDRLHRVQDTGRQSLGEMRRLLGVLRAAGPDVPATAPQPSLSGLQDLVDDAAAGGLPVEVTVDGDLSALPLGVELTAFRIAQEALTNTRRHAGATHATVRLAHRPGLLTLEVTDDGTGPVGSRTGHGLIGMRERVALYGGTLSTGAGPAGGYRVAAELPLEDAPLQAEAPLHEEPRVRG